MGFFNLLINTSLFVARYLVKEVALHRLHNQIGWGLLEMLAALSLISLSMVALSKILSVTIRSTRTIEARSEFEGLINSLKIVLRDPKLCANALFGGGTIPVHAYFNPDQTPPPRRELNSIRRGGTVFAQVGRMDGSIRITNLKLQEIDRTARKDEGRHRTRYLARLTVTANRIGSGYLSDRLSQDLVLFVTTNKKSHQIESCGSISGESSLFVTADLKLKLSYAAGCDGNSSPPNECYCGGLETVHRATRNNPNGNPYWHRSGFEPARLERPRAWLGTASCPEGYTATLTGVDCSVAGSGKMENIIPLSTTSVFAVCCAYTSDLIPDGTTASGKIRLVCVRNG